MKKTRPQSSEQSFSYRLRTAGGEARKFFAAIAVIAFLSTSLYPSIVRSEQKLQRAIEMFNDFNIREALKVFLKLKEEPSYSTNQKAIIHLYIGMCYAYLRNREKAIEFFKKAVQLVPSVELPPDSPKRLKKLFKLAKGSTPSNSEPEKKVGSAESPPAARSTPQRPPQTSEKKPVNSESPSAVRSTPQTSEKKPESASPRGEGIKVKPMGGSSEDRGERPPPPRRKIVFKMTFKVKRRSEVPGPRPRPLSPEKPQIERDKGRGLSKSGEGGPAKRAEDKSQLKSIEAEEEAIEREIEREFKGPKKKGGSIYLTLGLISSGVALSLFGGGIAMGALASSRASLANNPEIVQIDIPLIQNDARKFASAANGLYISAGIFAVGAATFFILHPLLSTPPKGKRFSRSR